MQIETKGWRHIETTDWKRKIGYDTAISNPPTRLALNLSVTTIGAWPLLLFTRTNSRTYSRNDLNLLASSDRVASMRECPLQHCHQYPCSVQTVRRFHPNGLPVRTTIRAVVQLENRTRQPSAVSVAPLVNPTLDDIEDMQLDEETKEEDEITSQFGSYPNSFRSLNTQPFKSFYCFTDFVKYLA